LEKKKLPHQVLNAKQHAREADIVAQAGRAKMITIATNMAGRGTDIVLGGNMDKAIEAVEADDLSMQQRNKQRSRNCARNGRRIMKPSRHWAACVSLRQSAMSPDALITNCVAAPGVREIRALRVFI